MGSIRLLGFLSTSEVKLLSFVCLDEDGEGDENGIRDDELNDDGSAVDDA